MGLKLKKSGNLLNYTVLKHKTEVFSVTLNSQLHCKESCSDFNKIRKSMDRFCEKSSRESIKNIMQQQEESFKQQVRELHRLYQVQKMLMAEARCEKAKKKKMSSFGAASNREIVADAINKLQSNRTTSETTHSSHASIRNNSCNVPNSEHTSANRSAAAMAAGHASPELIAKPGESPESCSNEECSLDLTLRIGCASDQMKSRVWKELEDSSSGFGAESLKRPHWLLQAMSLNRT